MLKAFTESRASNECSQDPLWQNGVLQKSLWKSKLSVAFGKVSLPCAQCSRPLRKMDDSHVPRIVRPSTVALATSTLPSSYSSCTYGSLHLPFSMEGLFTLPLCGTGMSTGAFTPTAPSQPPPPTSAIPSCSSKPSLASAAKRSAYSFTQTHGT